MPQARSPSGSSSKTATNSATTSNQNSNNLKSSLKANNTHFSSTSKSNNNNSLGDSGLSSEVSKNSSLGLQNKNGSSLRVAAPQQIEDSGTESGEDLRLIAAGIRDSMQIEGIENHSDMSLIKEVTNALNKLESSLKEGKDLALDNSKKSTLLALVERLQTGLTAPDKLSNAVGEQDFPDETSSPEADNHRSNRQRFAKRKNRNNRHTVGVSKEELADARRYMEEMVMIENLSNCTTPECNAATTPPELFAIQKQHSTGAILTSHEPQESSAGLFRPNQFVPNNLKHSTEAGSGHPEVQMRQKKGTPAPGQRQSTGDMDTIKVPNSNNGKRPLSDSFDAYTAQNNRVTFHDPNSQNDNSVEEKNEYNRSHHSDDKQNNHGRLSPDSNRLNRFNNKKQLMKRANTIDIPKTHRYNPEFDTDSDFEERSALNTKGLRGTLQVTVKRKPRQVVPNFEPKTENDHKFLAFIQKQNTTTGVGWNSSKSVSNWTNKFGNIKNVFEAGANTASSNKPKVSGPPSSSSAKSFWKKSEEQNPPKTSTSVLTSALKAKERNEKRSEVIVPKPIHLNQFSHNPQSAFRPVDTSPETIQMQFKPIPAEKSSNEAINSLSPTKAYNPNSVRRQALESPHYAQSSPTKSWIKKNTATNSPVSLPWTAKPPENNVLKIAATKFESQSPVQRHQSFKQQEKRPSLPNTSYPYQYQDYGHSQSSYVSNSQPTSYAEYPQQPRIYRESSLTNPQAEPLVLTSNAPAYSPHSLQPYDYYAEDLNQNAHQTDMTDDDIDDMESMTEYRVEAKVMGKPMSQQAVTVGKRTNHMSDDEVFGKNSKAAKNLLSVMKNIGNGKPDRPAKKPEKKQPPASCISPNGSAYQAPIVEPLFPEVTKFEANRDPEYIGKQKNKQQAGSYHQNPVYVPLEDYQHNEPPVAPPRGRKVSQETKKGSAYVPKERSNVYQSPRRDAPSSLPIQAGPTSPPRYMYSSPIESPVSSSTTSQILSDGMYMQNVPAFRKPYSEPNTPSDYSTSNDQYFNQYGHIQKSYPAPQPPVILPQIPLETSYTKVYDQPRDVSSFYQPPLENPNSSAYVQSSPKVQQSSQPSKYIPPEYQQKPEIPQQYYQPSPKVQQSPMPQEYASQQAYQPRSEIPPDYYSSPKVQQNPQQFIPQQVYQPRAEAPQEYYQAPRTQQIPQPQVPAQYYQAPKAQPSPVPQLIAPQYTDTPVQYEHSPRVPQSSRPDVPQSYYQSPKTQQSPQHSSSEIPLQYSQSPRTPQSQSSVTQQGFKYPQPPQSQTYQPSKTQQSPQPIYQPKAPMIQAKPQVPPKNESVMQSSKFQHSSSTYQQQSIQNVVMPKRPAEQQAPNAAVLCKQASLEGRNRVQSQSQKYEQVEETRRKSLGNVLEVTRIEREAREQKAAAIKQDMYSVQQDVYSQQKSISKKTEVHQQETKVMYKSSAPDDTPDIVKSSLKKDDIPILKKFGPPQRHCYMPNAYQNPLMKSETSAVLNNAPKTVSRKFSDPAVSRGPLIVEIPSTPQPDSQDEIPRNIVFNKISAFTSMSRKQTEASTEYTSQQNRPNKLSKCDSWHQICQLQNVPKPPSPRFNQHGNAAIRRSKSNHTLALPKLYEASYDRAEISEKQRTVAAYFTGQKSPNSLSRNSSQTNLADECNYVSVKKSSINRIKTSEKASISRQDPSSGLSRSHTMPQIANVNLLDESNVEDAFEQLMNGS
ncbi:titin-like [Eupeodes corollae]|uniref:titin-like n=1 Tax=Eupeodes corollae TaxID=290404 RepID=UPI0024937201|nr:titin-like [Eupeodes corollae]